MRDGPFTCGNCEFGEGRHATDEQAALAEKAGHPVAPLFCLRYPARLAKRPDEGCGEHSGLIAERQAALVAAIAAALMPKRSV